MKTRTRVSTEFMILHTDFHDYYDAAIGYGADSNVHYNRYTKEIELSLKFKFDFPRLFWEARALLLGFCGEIYPLIVLVKYDSDYRIVDRFHAYNINELIVKRKEWTNAKSSFYNRYEKQHEKRRRIEAERFFANWRQRDDTVFLENKVPVWLYQIQSYERKAILNPRLKTYEFFRVKDATAAFQEISMYLSNILIERKETAVIEDKYRIEQHGFDLKTSFRREKRKRSTD